MNSSEAPSAPIGSLFLRAKADLFSSNARIKVIVLFLRLLADPSDADSLKQLLSIGCPTLRKTSKSLCETAFANGKTLIEACWRIVNGGERAFRLSADEVGALKEVLHVTGRALRRLKKVRPNLSLLHPRNRSLIFGSEAQSNDLVDLINWLSRHSWYRSHLSAVGTIPAIQETQNLEDLKNFAGFVEPKAEHEDDLQGGTAYLKAFVHTIDLAAESDTQLVPRYPTTEVSYENSFLRALA